MRRRRVGPGRTWCCREVSVHKQPHACRTKDQDGSTVSPEGCTVGLGFRELLFNPQHKLGCFKEKSRVWKHQQW